MKFALLVTLCLAFAFVVNSFEEEEFMEDEDQNEKRFFWKKCSTDADCADGECCFKKSFFSKCKARRAEGSYCYPKSNCYFKCQEGLECRKSGLIIHKCARPLQPTEEPGPGDVEM